jgi:hypothetical protein
MLHPEILTCIRAQLPILNGVVEEGQREVEREQKRARLDRIRWDNQTAVERHLQPTGDDGYGTDYSGGS